MDTFSTIQRAYHDIASNTIHFSPNKALGQNFLRNTHIAQAIVELLPHTSSIHTLEIGPGRGALTGFLQERSSPLYIIERDPYWATIHSARVQTICADALTFDYARLHASHGVDWQCISNLPYNIASPLLWEIISQAQCYCVFMVQKEVGERLLAREHSKDYGMLSVWIQSFCTPKKEYIVRPDSFFPAPKVDSMVLSFQPHNKEQIERIPASFDSFLHYAFSHRRKQLLPRLQKYFRNAQDIFDTYAIPYTTRTEELPVHILQDIARDGIPL
ncbi:MAG: 16S rRNA (adenine(1518)-N(6)/adenine(1519)-N(6))-dimethyltransferase RsmA [Desulfovibrionaceae bacterium]|nr:16S rRNA (adenine(1518)-N(6)/adenine(1519)-N(6))-dimethyltransferase RsmA [Desulfovibrionaceae bacterium]